MKQVTIVQVTARDRAIFTYIGRAGIASLDQLQRRHWAGNRVQTATDRLLKLKRAGLLTMHYTDARGARERVYALTKAGRALLDPGEQQRVRVGLAPRREHKQQLLAQDYRLRLEREVTEQGGHLRDWFDERELRSERELHKAAGRRAPRATDVDECADARAVIADADGRQREVEIEIDGQYYGQMLAGKMGDLARSAQRNGRAVHYVCLSHRLKLVQAAAAPYREIEVISL